MMMVKNELFSPTDQDNKDSTSILEELAVIVCTRWRDEMVDPKKGTWQFLSDSGGELSFDHCSEVDKIALRGFVDVNDLAESSFAGLTAQVQVFGRIGMANAAAISDMKRNGFLSRDGEGNGLFHDLPPELQLTALMTALQFAPDTRQLNNAGLERARETKRQKEELLKQLGLEKATNEYIDCLIYHKMYDSDRCWKTAAEVRNRVKNLQYKKDKFAALKDNIQIRFMGFGWEDWHTTWSKNGKNKTIPELQRHLIDKINESKKRKIPTKPPTQVPQRKQMAVVGTLSAKAQELDRVAKETEEEFDLNARRTWKDNEEKGFGSVLQEMLELGKKAIDASFIGTRIEYLCNFDMNNEGTIQERRWCAGVVKSISDGTAPTWLKPNAVRACYKANEAAYIDWDPIPDGNFEKGPSTVELDPGKWNKDCIGAWRKWQPDIDYGV